VWLNLGDSYIGSGGQGTTLTSRSKVVSDREVGVKAIKVNGLKPKDLVGIPWRVAFALQADGWYLAPGYHLAASQTQCQKVSQDRCTKAHEYIFLLSKSPKYYYDNEAIKEDSAESSKDRLNQDIKNQKGSIRVPGKTNGTMNAVGGEKRNKRSVWAVATQSYSEAHFATYPPELIKPCILAGCPEGGTVLDPFGGSGTTAQVASNLNRNAILCELNPEYVEIAKGRLHDSLGMFLDMTVETPQH
jgi:hypothetical protein